MKEFAIITNKYRDEKGKLTEKIVQYIKQKGGNCTVLNNIDENTGKYRIISQEETPDNLECVITIGGDGTLLHAAKDLKGRDVLFVGINKGNLGFLAEIHQDEIKRGIDRLIDDQFNVECRMMLNGGVYRNGKKIYSGDVLNDIVIHRGGDLAVTCFEVYVNGQLLGEYTADGVILSTPTGSTAYNLSAGGPVARPDSQMILMTPICPHTIGNRSIIFAKQDVLEIHIKKAKQPNVELRKAVFDGDGIVDLISGDFIRVKAAEEQTKIVKLDEGSFLQAIKDKLGD